MQRETPEGIIISCDFCGRDWDPYDTEQALPMTEGHHGSVICLACLRHALEQAAPADGEVPCTLCLQHKPPGTRAWSHPAAEPSAGRNPAAEVCWSCIRLAAKTFHKDSDVDFRWDPSHDPPDG
jgi:hypothetical protein